MSQNLTTYAIGQMPHVTSPDLLDMEIVRQLTADGFDRATKPFAFAQLIRRQWRRLAIFCRYRKLKSLLFKKLLMKGLREIPAISQEHVVVAFGQFRGHANVVHIGGGQIERLDHAERADFDMQAKSINGLITQLFVIMGYPFDELAEPGSGKSTDRDRKAIDHGHDIPKSPYDVFKESLLDLPEVSRVTDKTDSAGERGEVVPVKVFEESEDIFVRVKIQHFAHDFQRKDFTVRHLWRRTSASQSSLGKALFHKIIRFAKDIDDKIIKMHRLALHDQWNNVLLLTCIFHRPEGLLNINTQLKTCTQR